MVGPSALLRIAGWDLRAATTFRRVTGTRLYSSAQGAHAHARSKPQLDPSLEALLQDVDISLHNYKSTHKHRELDVISTPEEGTELQEYQDDAGDEYHGRKSPAAHFGSDRTGSMILPHELQNAISELISGDHLIRQYTTGAVLTVMQARISQCYGRTP